MYLYIAKLLHAIDNLILFYLFDTESEVTGYADLAPV